MFTSKTFANKLNAEHVLSMRFSGPFHNQVLFKLLEDLQSFDGFRIKVIVKKDHETIIVKYPNGNETIAIRNNYYSRSNENKLRLFGSSEYYADNEKVEYMTDNMYAIASYIVAIKTNHQK